MAFCQFLVFYFLFFLSKKSELKEINKKIIVADVSILGSLFACSSIPRGTEPVFPNAATGSQPGSLAPDLAASLVRWGSPLVTEPPFASHVNS